ncbi:acyl-CoA dehydrogenase family protein [Sphaerisporangium corydalis]|uniref:Acyl-CoA dehydrogenase family protein n=1 Tax=Sphaerisporangium corydalis TaxID=1441875 RepID=A0ABV9ES66_9ACTN|nr:acyl-CoA dehydrogenase family protein [Sphaerisporangium corydalis]
MTELVDRAARYAAEVDGARRLRRESVAALVTAGFPRHFVPRRWGGAAGGFAPLVEAAITVGESCPATAWCATLFATHGRIAAYLPEQAQEEIWGPHPDTLIAASVMPPSGRATPVPGGWSLRGEWGWASGVDFADWVLLASMVTDGDQDTVRIFAVPAGSYLVKDTWRAAGMRGTGTNTVSLCDTFVPEHRTVTLPELLGTRRPGEARCHNVPYTLVAAVMFAGPLAGAALGAVADCVSTGAARPPSDPGARQALARSSPEASAARLLLREAAGRADRGMVDARTIAQNRCDAAVAAELCVSAVDRLFAARGEHGPAEDDPVHRRWRDVHTAAGHGALRFAPAADAYAKAVLG